MASSLRARQDGKKCNVEEGRCGLVHAREERVPGQVMLRCIGACAEELAVEHTQVIHVSDSERSPTMRCTARAVTAYLIREQQLDSLPNSVVMGFDDARSSVLVDELDKALVVDRQHKMRIHLLTR